MGDVGNRGRVEAAADRLSKTPELHSQDLENPATGQPLHAQPLMSDFHFSCHNYGVLLSFLLSTYSFPTLRHALELASTADPHIRTASQALRNSLPRDRPETAKNRSNPGIQRSVLLFHPPWNAEDEYNQTRRRDRPFRPCHNVLYCVASAGMCFSRRG